MDVRFALCFLLFCVVNADRVKHKLCKDVSRSKCTIGDVELDTCVKGPMYCRLKRGKPYSLSFSYTPHFQASSMMVSILGDVNKKSDYDTTIVKPTNACELSWCNVEKDTQKDVNITFSIDQSVKRKFPIQVKVWDEANTSDACCFTFKAMIKDYE